MLLEGPGYYYMQCNNAEIDIVTLVSCVKCNQSDFFTSILVSDIEVPVLGL